MTSPYKEEDGGGGTNTGLLRKRPLMCPEQNHKPSMNYFKLRKVLEHVNTPSTVICHSFRVMGHTKSVI